MAFLSVARIKNAFALQKLNLLAAMLVSFSFVACTAPTQDQLGELIGNPTVIVATPTPTSGGLQIVAGNAQTVGVGSTASSELTVRAVDDNGSPVSGIPVTFAVSGTGSVNAVIDTTDGDGLASVSYTAGGTAGAVTVSASSSLGSANFTITVVALTSFTIQKVSGNAQSGSVNGSLGTALTVLVLDSNNLPAPNTLVLFTVESNNGTIGGNATSLQTTNASGFAQVNFTLGTASGANSVKAALLAAPAIYTTFSATGTVPSNSTVDLSESTISLSSNTAQANNTTLITVTVRVKDQYGNLIPNNSQTIATTLSPEIGSWQTSSTFSYTSTGTYTNTYKVGSTAGTEVFSTTINAAALASGSASLVITAGNSNSAGGASLTVVSGNSQSLQIGQTAASPLKVIALDSLGLPVANSSVTFTVSGGTGSGTVEGAASTAVNTASDGTAEVDFVGTTAGTVTVSVSSLQGTAAFSLTVQDLTGYTVNKVNAGTTNNQTAIINTALTNNMKVQVLNGSNQPVASAQVRFQCQSANCGTFSNGTDAITITTDATGYAEAAYTLGTATGTYTVRAILPQQASMYTDYTHTATVSGSATVSLAQSTVGLSSSSLQANGLNQTTVTVTLKDQYGNTIPTCSKTVTASFSPSTGAWQGGGFSCSSSSGVYTRTYQVGTSGSSEVVTASVDASPVTQTATLTLLPNSYDLTVSATTRSVATLTANNTDTSTLTFSLKDAYGNLVYDADHLVQFVATPDTLGTLVGSITNVGDGTYTQVYKAGTNSQSGSVSFQAQLKDNGAGSWLTAGSAVTVAFQPGPVSMSTSTFTATKMAMPVNSTSSLIVSAKDAYNNPISTGLTVAITKSSGTGTIGSVTNNGDGTYSALVTAPASTGSGVFAATINSVALSQSPLTLVYANLAGGTITCANYNTTGCGGVSCVNADIYVEAGTLTIDTRDNDALGCSLNFNSVTIGSGGVLTNTTASLTHTYGMEFTVTNALIIQSGGSINVNGKGYPSIYSSSSGNGYTQGGQGSGATGIYNNATCLAGGSHGGKGAAGNISACYGASTVSTNALYDTPSDPTYPGASGAGYNNQSSYSGAGGGVIRITAASITNDGTISANGNSATGGYAAGGAGGSIKLTMTGGGTLTGTGMITANGGLGGPSTTVPSLASGGGGMIALIGDDTSFPLSRLRVNAGSTLGFQSMHAVSNGGTIYRSLGAYTTAQTLLSDLYVDGSGTNIFGSSTPLTFGDGTLTPGLTLRNSTLNLSSLTIMNGAYITTTYTPSGGAYSQASLNIANTLTINNGGRIITDGRGYPATYGSVTSGYTVGNTTTGGALNAPHGWWNTSASASHGGRGSIAFPAVNNPSYYVTTFSAGTNAIYDSASNPIYPGASGATGHTAHQGGSGGGVVIITANNIVNNGSISSNGNPATSGWGGAGAGGTVNLTLSGTLTGSGTIQANGGAGTGTRYESGAGGGRIAISGDDSAWTLPQYSVSSGSAGALTYSTGGTIYRSLGAYSGAVTLNSDLLVDNSGSTTNIFGPATELTLATGKILTLDTAVSMASLTLNANSYLTHSFAVGGSNPIPSINLTLSGALTIANGAEINANYRGYAPGYTVGNVTTGAALANSGASYGGRGGVQGYSSTYASNVTYGSASDPAYPGAGSMQSSGGGLIRITAAGIVNNGVISANGAYQVKYNNSWANYGTTVTNAGAGGGIKLTLSGSSQLTGSGIISASATGDSSQLYAAYHSYSRSYVGGGGRIAIIGDDSLWPLSQIYVNAGVSLSTLTYQNAIFTPGTFYRSLGAYVGAQTLNSDVWINADSSTSNFLGSSTDLTIASTKTLLTDIPINVNNLTLNTNSLVTSDAAISPNINKVDITAAGTITVPANASIDVSRKGYQGSTTPFNQNINVGLSYNWANNASGAWNSGACHAVRGGNNAIGQTWDTAANPQYPGGAGNGYNSDHGSGSGGGVIRLSADTLTLAGNIKADGGHVSGVYATAGAGGSIYINAANLNFSGSPVISADGGSAASAVSPAAGSAGGLIKIVTPVSQSGSITPTANAGTPSSGGAAGGAGTVTGP